MARGNKDRYGYRHRQDSAHDIGDSAPGTYGDSQGTFHDRASQDSNVIVDGKVQSAEKAKSASSKQSNNTKSTKSSSKSGKDSNKKVSVTVTRISSSGNAIAEYNGKHVHVDGGEVGETYTVKLSQKSGYYRGKQVERNKQ